MEIKNQEKIINNDLDLDLIDLTLLDYVANACSRPSMIHMVDDNNQPYVWLKHSKILEDLPILRIGEESLKKRLKNLTDIGLLKSIVTTQGTKGKRAYYTITNTCEELRYNNQVYQNTLDTEQSSVPKYTSDKQLNNNINKTDNTNVLSTENSVEEFLTQDTPKKSTTKKQNLYSSCLMAIDEFTSNQEVRDCLKEYLNMRLANRSKPIGIASFKGMLKKLRTLTDSKEMCVRIIQQATDRCYLTFYPIKGPTYNTGCPEIISPGEKRQLTDEEYEEALNFGEKF